ncbi:MAG: T9SS type A sorting domain-containing protein [Saprospiraceae bacterium]|nr:T9SS type A sorting domain-containing protein [Saprospiraceae bacterium]
MYQSTIQTLTTIFTVMVLTITAYGQTEIYTFTFDNDMEGWTSTGLSDTDAVWVWAPNGDAGTGAFNNGQTPIASESGGGALLFDSDGLDNGGDDANQGGGPAPSPQMGEVVSPSLDFTGQDQVILAFNQYYRYFAKSADDFTTPASSVEVSNDGGTTWTSYLVNEDISPNQATRPNDIVALDISEVAGNQADVLVKFVWDGDYYFWLIDDVKLFDSRGVDLVVLDFTNIDNFETPDFAMNTDSFDLEMMVTNNSDMDLPDSIMFLTRILTDETRDLIFSDTGWVVGLNAGDTVIWDFDRNWVPTTPNQERYILAYNVRYRGDTMPEAVAPDDNVDFNRFDVRDFSFRKLPPTGRTQGFNFGGNPYDVANFLSLPETVAEPLIFDKITFKVCEGDDPLVGKTIIGFIVQLPDTAAVLKGVLLNGETDLIGLNAGTSLDDLIRDQQVIGIGSKLFTQGEEASQCEDFTIDMLSDLDGESDQVEMMPGGKYLVGLRFGTGASDLFIGTNEDYKVWQLSSIVSTPGDGSDGWGIVTDYQENAADIGVELTMTTAVDDNPLPENTVAIFPNPTSDYIRVNIEFETPTEATVFMADANGKILNIKPLKNVQREQVNFDMGRYPSGTYIVRVATREGTKTEHVIVTH